jgi:Kef-type K+ transport system membrane component KefB
MMLTDHPALIVLAVAVAAPLLAEIPIGVRVPVVVLEVLLGMFIGPHVLGWLDASSFLTWMQNAGTAALLFMAGMEIDFAKIRGRPLSLGILGWAIAVGLAFVAVALLHVVPGVHAPLMVTIALTTTSLGVILSTLRDSGQMDAPFGRLLVAAGAVGEVAPIVAVALLLSTRFSTLQEFGLLFGFLALVALAATVGSSARPPRVLALLSRTLHASTQLPIRLILLLLAGMVVLAHELGLENILGAFSAGMVIGLATRGEEGEPVRVKLDAVMFGWLTPFFFVGTGMQFDPSALTRDFTTMLLIPTFLLLLLLVHWVPVFIYRGELTRPERLPFALSASVASLGLTMVITRIGVAAKHMNPDIAQALVAAAMLSLLVFPTLAGILLSRAAPPARSADSG